MKSSNRWNFFRTLFPIVGTFLAAGCEVMRPPPSVPAPGPVPVLCLAARDLEKQGLDHLDPLAVAAYREAGFDLRFGYYEDATAESLARYPVVVGMMPMLYPGTRVLDDRLGPALEAYIRKGGGFLLLPGPSYYGVQDFPRHLNPWLAPLGAELLNEQPRDPAHQQTLNRVLGYRYLGTRNVASHPATRGVAQVWLPLDFSDAYLATHALRVDDTWQVLVRGEPSCVTRPYDEQRAGRVTLGSYSSAPPFLAVRDVGRGRVALFATSSQYFFFDAYHPAFADGFVMREGGLRLMTQLLAYLGEHAKPSGVPVGTVAARPTVAGNVSIFDEKDAWLRHVQEHLQPTGSTVAGYIDCGSLADLPYTPARGIGFVGADHWLIRWSWSEVFHPTAANSRGFDRRPLVYRFSGLDPQRRHRVGVLAWGWQAEGARDMRITAGDRVLREAWALPRVAEGQGPRFECLDLPAGSITSNGVLDLSFGLASSGGGSFSSLGELWLFADGEGPAHSPAELRAKFESPSADRVELLQPTPVYRGLIGARSELSGGGASVADLCAAAREAGCDFLAFTEDAHRLGPEGLARLQEACRAASSDTFRALPGVRWSARYAQEQERRPDAPYSWGDVQAYTFQPLRQLPDMSTYDNAYTVMWKFFGGELGAGRPATPTFAHPARSAIPPWFTRFWRGFDVITLDAAGRVAEDARALYEDLLASGYGPHPRVSAPLDSVAAVRAVAASGWRTFVRAPTLEEADLFHYTSWIGNGPVLDTFSVSFDYARDVGSGEGLLFQDQAWLQVHVGVTSSTTLARVTLFSGTTPLRVWHPGAATFRVQEPLLVARNHELWLQATTVDGREAVSGRLLAEDTRFMMAMCSDNQNSICNVSRPATRYVRDDRELFLAHSYWHTGEAYGQLGALRDARQLVPRVIETGIIQPVKYFIPTPVLHFADGTREDHLFSRMRITGASRDFNTVTYTFDPPGARARSTVRLTAFRPAFEGDTVVLVETVLTALEDLPLRSDGRGIEHLRLAMLPDLAANRRYAWIGPAGLQGGDYVYDAPMAAVTGRLAAAGGALLWPSDVGALLALPLDDRVYDATFERLAKSNAREALTLSSAPGLLRARRGGEQPLRGGFAPGRGRHGGGTGPPARRLPAAGPARGADGAGPAGGRRLSAAVPGARRCAGGAGGHARPARPAADGGGGPARERVSGGGVAGGVAGGGDRRVRPVPHGAAGPRVDACLGRPPAAVRAGVGAPGLGRAARGGRALPCSQSGPRAGHLHGDVQRGTAGAAGARALDAGARRKRVAVGPRPVAGAGGCEPAGRGEPRGARIPGGGLAGRRPVPSPAGFRAGAEPPRGTRAPRAAPARAGRGNLVGAAAPPLP
jgi:hypothetical protein